MKNVKIDLTWQFIKVWFLFACTNTKVIDRVFRFHFKTRKFNGLKASGNQLVHFNAYKHALELRELEIFHHPFFCTKLACVAQLIKKNMSQSIACFQVPELVCIKCIKEKFFQPYKINHPQESNFSPISNFTPDIVSTSINNIWCMSYRCKSVLDEVSARVSKSLSLAKKRSTMEKSL